MKIYLFFLLIILNVSIVCAQKQGNIWYFGDHAGLNFNTGNPVALTNGQTILINGIGEGTAVICDSSGSLLFYSNGNKIWNRNQQIMMNGDSLLSNFSSTQSSLIVPLPGSNQLFYLFTTDDWDIDNLQYGLRYSVVDMCLDNGLGAIIIGQKNNLLLDTVSEKLTAVRHKNGNDYWIIAHKYFSDKFYAYLFTNNGIVDTVITQIGSIHSDNCSPPPPYPSRAAIGYMKASPNGKKLALVSLNTCDNLKELFDFNDSSGVVSNYIDLELQGEGFGGYGLSFSPDNSKLYFTNAKNVYQYDLNTGNANSIRNSKTQVSSFTSFTNDASLALQIGPDGKIYVARPNKQFLAVINNPDQQGLNCNFQDSAVFLNNKTCNMGLPNFIGSYAYSNTIVNCETGINEVDNSELTIKISPNPSNSTFTIQLPTQQTFQLKVIDITGRNVYENKNATGTVTIDASGFSSGIYFVKAVNQRTVLTGKVVKE